MRFYSAVSTLTLCEMLLAPHHWVNNYRIGFCDTWGYYLKAFVGKKEALYPIAGYRILDKPSSHGTAAYVMDIQPFRAQRHCVELMYPLPDVEEERNKARMLLRGTRYRITIKHDGKPFYLSDWETIYPGTYDTREAGRKLYSACPFGMYCDFMSITLATFDNSYYPWSYTDWIELTVEFDKLKIDFQDYKAILAVYVYNSIEL